MLRRNRLSKQIGALMGQGKKEEAEEVKSKVDASNARISMNLSMKKKTDIKKKVTEDYDGYSKYN